MVFASKYFVHVRNWILTVATLTLAMFLISCTAPEQKPSLSDKNDIKLEPRSSLLLWHDVTHKSYFGLKGPVKKLIIKPTAIASHSGEEVSDEWEIDFSPEGRVTSKVKLNDEAGFKTEYTYSTQGVLARVDSYKEKKIWRTSSFIYNNAELVRIDFVDEKSAEQQTIKVSRQKVTDGWIEIQKPITTPGLPMYSQFLNDGTLVWNNRGDINNGLGELYYIRTVDSVTSSSVVNNGTVYMRGTGGYRYGYTADGLLKTVESYNAHANRLFHKTSYRYNALALLVAEKREVTDTSPFNEAINETVDYDYQSIDTHGNWTSRKLTVSSKFQTQVFYESREITYY